MPYVSSGVCLRCNIIHCSDCRANGMHFRQPPLQAYHAVRINEVRNFQRLPLPYAPPPRPANRYFRDHPACTFSRDLGNRKGKCKSPTQTLQQVPKGPPTSPPWLPIRLSRPSKTCRDQNKRPWGVPGLSRGPLGLCWERLGSLLGRIGGLLGFLCPPWVGAMGPLWVMLAHPESMCFLSVKMRWHLLPDDEKRPMP